MANQLILKKGLDAARTVITPAEGELVYATDTKKVFIGDGATAGGNAVGITTAQATAITTNTAKVTNATHSGEVTGSGALTITPGAVTLAKMANGTAGNLIAFNATGAPAAVATGAAGDVLTSNGVGTAPTMQTPAGGGKVLQIVHVNYSTETIITSTAFMESGLTASIVPSLASSNILILISINGIASMLSGGALQSKLARGGIAISGIDNMAGYTNMAGASGGQSSFNFLDSPNSAAAVTYSVLVRSSNGTNATFNTFYNMSAVSSMTLMEVAV